jgi:hypothetical protein
LPFTVIRIARAAKFSHCAISSPKTFIAISASKLWSRIDHSIDRDRGKWGCPSHHLRNCRRCRVQEACTDGAATLPNAAYRRRLDHSGKTNISRLGHNRVSHTSSARSLRRSRRRTGRRHKANAELMTQKEVLGLNRLLKNSKTRPAMNNI